MVKRNEPVTPDKLKYIQRMSIKTVCNLFERVHLEIGAAFPRFNESLEICYDMLFDELYRRNEAAMDLWIEDEKWTNPYKYFAPEVGAGEGAE